MSHYHLVQKWIKEGEGPQLDFKKTIKSPAKIAKTLVAYANSRGGKLVVGITDEGRIKGVKPESEQYTLTKACSEYCSPIISISFEELNVDRVVILVAHIRESNEKPHYALDENGQSHLYVRIKDESVIAPDFIKNVILDGDLNNIRRTTQLIELRDKLIDHIGLNGPMSVADYMAWKSTSERNANRLLADLVLEGSLNFQYMSGDLRFTA